MNHQVLHGSGVDTDIATGLPKTGEVEERQQQAIHRYREKMQQSLGLAQELQAGSPVVTLLADRYRKRLQVLAIEDEECRALLQIIGALRHTLEVAPLEAEKEIRRILGPQLVHFLEEEGAAPT